MARDVVAARRKIPGGSKVERELHGVRCRASIVFPVSSQLAAGAVSLDWCWASS